MSRRPARRTLVRWNDDHDKELLLWINYCCVEQGIKIPFARVAQCMGPSFTEGACVQHLAKIRNKMDAVGLHVPPAQKRGTITKPSSSVYRQVLKTIHAPPPRIRPANQDGSQEDGYFDDDEEEEPEEHSPSTGNSGRHEGKHTIYRQARSRKGPAKLKRDSSEDDPIPQSELDQIDDMLYDSDKEYGAKRPKTTSEDSKNVGAKIQMKLKLSGLQNPAQPGSQPSDAVGYDHGGSTKDNVGSQTSQHTPTLKYETMEDGLANTIPQSGSPATSTRTTRRKSSAMATGDDDDEYEPGTASKGRSKKPKTSRTPKKQKVVSKKDGKIDKQKASAAVPECQEVSIYDVDRVAMPPPPPLPNINTDSAFAWNNNFMHQPFGPPSSHSINFNSMNISDGSFNDISPATEQFGRLDRLTSAGLGRTHNSNPYMGAGYLASNTNPTFHAAQSRNPSFASTSTVDTQPASWNRTFSMSTDTWNTPAHRHPFFRSPQEAAKALHANINNEDNSEVVQTDELNNGTLALGDPFNPDVQQAANNGGVHVDGEADSLFIGPAESFNDGLIWSDWVNDEYLA